MSLQHDGLQQEEADAVAALLAAASGLSSEDMNVSAQYPGLCLHACVSCPFLANLTAAAHSWKFTLACPLVLLLTWLQMHEGSSAQDFAFQGAVRRVDHRLTVPVTVTAAPGLRTNLCRPSEVALH